MTSPNAPNSDQTPIYVGDGLQRHAHDEHDGYGPAYHNRNRDWGQWPFGVYNPPPEKQPASATTPHNV